MEKPKRIFNTVQNSKLDIQRELIKKAEKLQEAYSDEQVAQVLNELSGDDIR